MLDLTKPEGKPSQEYWDKRNDSIERQVAAKCVAQVFEGAGYKWATDGVQEKDFVVCFNIFLKLIRG